MFLRWTVSFFRARVDFCTLSLGTGANAPLCRRGGSAGQDLSSVGLTNRSRANLGHRAARGHCERLKEEGWEVPDERVAKTADRKEERQFLGEGIFSENLPRPRTVTLLQAKRSLRTGGDPAGPWAFVYHWGGLGGIGRYQNAQEVSCSQLVRRQARSSLLWGGSSHLL